MPRNPFLDQIVEASGLSSIFAKATILRVLDDKGIDPTAFSPEDVPTILARLEQVLQTYLDHAEARHRFENIKRLAGPAPATRG